MTHCSTSKLINSQLRQSKGSKMDFESWTCISCKLSNKTGFLFKTFYDINKVASQTTIETKN